LSEPGYFAVDFEVGGTIDRPKSDLMEKIVGKDLKDFGSAINRFLGGKTDRQKKKKSSDSSAESPPSSPAAVQPEGTATPATPP
jgi:hypothetical protein